MNPDERIVVQVTYPTAYDPPLAELDEIGKHVLQLWPRETHDITFDLATKPDRGVTFTITSRTT